MVDCHCKTTLNSLAEFGREDLDVTWTETQRGFVLGEFRDLYGQECSLQESSSAEYTAIWFGVGGCRMHLTIDQVRGLIEILRTWADDDKPLGFTDRTEDR